MWSFHKCGPYNYRTHLVRGLDSVWIQLILHLRLVISRFFLFFFHVSTLGDKIIVHALFTRPTTTLLKKKIKNWFHSTIYPFKNYFATVFSIFNFQQNKLCPNRPLVYEKVHHISGTLVLPSHEGGPHKSCDGRTHVTGT